MSAYCCLPLQREPSRKVCISPYYKMVFHEILFSTNEIFVGCKSNVLGVFLRVHFSKVFFPLPASHELFYSCACAYLNSNAPSYFFFLSACSIMVMMPCLGIMAEMAPLQQELQAAVAGRNQAEFLKLMPTICG